MPSRKENSESPFWREALAPYAQPSIGRSVLDLATSVVPYLVLSVTIDDAGIKLIDWSAELYVGNWRRYTAGLKRLR